MKRSGVARETIVFDYLGNRPELLPKIAAWYFGEWGHFHPGASVQTTVERLQQTRLALADVIKRREEEQNT